MKNTWLMVVLVLTGLAACSDFENPAMSSGQVGITVQAPASMQAYAPFAPLATAGEAEPCATLQSIRTVLQSTGGGTALTPPDEHLSQNIEVSYKDIPVDEYTLTVEIISAANLSVYVGQVTLTILADQVANITVPLIETGGCPRPLPLPATIYAHPKATGCDKFTLAGNKTTNTVLTSTAIEGKIGVDEDSFWQYEADMIDPRLAEGFSLKTAWSDDLNITSTGNIESTTHYWDKQPGFPLLCFDPYAENSNHFAVSGGGDTYTLAWDNPSNDSNYKGSIWLLVEPDTEFDPPEGDIADVTISNDPGITVLGASGSGATIEILPSDVESLSVTINTPVAGQKIIGYTVYQPATGPLRYVESAVVDLHAALFTP